VSPYLDRLEELAAAAQDASNAEDTAATARRENQVVGEACQAVGELSANGDISKAEKNQLAGVLSDELAQYTKTDLKNEFDDYFQREQSGIPFDELIEERLQEIVVIKSTDHRQGAMFRWHFSDGVQLETETTEEGTRLHRAWQQFKELYFEARVAGGEGERISDPTQERRDSDQWREFINDLILDHATTVEHVGPRTEAVRQLRDHIERHAAYSDMQTVRNRAGVGIEPAAETVADLDGGARIRVPTQDIKRICDQVGITTRALQVELDARGLTADDMAGVSDATYDDGGGSTPAPAVGGGGPDDPPDGDDYESGLNESLGTDPGDTETDGGER